METISDPGEDAFEPALAVDSSGNAVAVWTRYQSSKTMVQAAVRPAGGSFGAARDTVCRGPELGLAAGLVRRAAARRWRCGPATTAAGATSNVQASVRPAGGSFGAVQSLSVPGQDAYEPQVAAGVDADNNAAVCWTRYDGAATPNLRIQCARRRNVTGYPRPQAATPIFAPLVVAYNPCTSSNRVHAPPLNSGVVQPAGAQLERADGGVARREHVPPQLQRLDPLEGDPRGPEHRRGRGRRGHRHRHPDVRNNPGNTDYVGKRARNQPAADNRQEEQRRGEPRTGDRADLPARTCRSTAQRWRGVKRRRLHPPRTVDALIPGAVVERRAPIWELGQFEVKDAGPNGTGYGARLPAHLRRRRREPFLRQGVFVP